MFLKKTLGSFTIDILKKTLYGKFYHTVVLKRTIVWVNLASLLSNILVKQQKLVRSRDIFQILIRTTYNSTPMGIFSTNQGGITKDTPSSTSIPRRGDVVIDIKKNLSSTPEGIEPVTLPHTPRVLFLNHLDLTCSQRKYREYS